MKAYPIFLLGGLILASACDGKPVLELTCEGGVMLMQQSDFGIQTNMRTWDSTAVVADVVDMKVLDENYTMITGKRSQCHNTGIGWTYIMVNPQNDTLLVEMRHYQDGSAFRYILPHVMDDEVLTRDLTTYHIPAGSNRWMQKYSGPGYENFFPLCPDGVSPEGEKYTLWGIPALVELNAADAGSDGNPFVLITEADVLRGNCASILENTADNRNDYHVHLFDRELPLYDGWTSPWRVVIGGSLAKVVESTLVTDVATPCLMDDVSWIEPGVSSWIYWAYNHGSQEYSILKEYVDLAVQMQWPYTLVDAEWDVMRGGDIEQLVRYSVAQGVKPMIWYNSTTGWYGPGVPTPQGLLNDEASRKAEFAKIASWGVSGVKIDFFLDDNARMMAYYIDLIEAAAHEKMLVNFHGGTIPRGWQRTYPNFISAEGVYGAEWYNNRPTLTAKAACHNATLPFTRNVIGSMDYTPGTFTDSQHPHITTHAHELALPVLFESGIQHMPDRPESYLSLPTEVRQLLSTLPTAWDDTRLLSGYPGRSVILARQKGSSWYVAGINGLDEEQTFKVDLTRLAGVADGAHCLLITDGSDNHSFSIDSDHIVQGPLTVVCRPRGGFVIKL